MDQQGAAGTRVDIRLRSRGRALYIAVSGLDYYRETNLPFMAQCRRLLDQVLADG